MKTKMEEWYWYVYIWIYVYIYVFFLLTQTVSVTSGQAKVKPGDFIGTMYDAATGKGVVPYEQSNKPRVTTGELGRFWNQKTKATKVPVGFEATFGLRTFQRTVALEPVLSEE